MQTGSSSDAKKEPENTSLRRINSSHASQRNESYASQRNESYASQRNESSNVPEKEEEPSERSHVSGGRDQSSAGNQSTRTTRGVGFDIEPVSITRSIRDLVTSQCGDQVQKVYVEGGEGGW
jgi:hypothetical protein